MPSKIVTKHKSIKYDAIDKTNSKTVISVGIAVFLLFFAIFAVRSLYIQSRYHGRVTEQKNIALKQLKQNQKALEGLTAAYKDFNEQTTNVIGGSATGSGPRDGTNTEVVLDALPNRYDYPALSSSFEKILRDGNYDIESIGGTEDATLTASSQVPTKDAKPVEVPYSFTVTSSTQGILELLQTLEKSIRPIYVDNLQLQSSGANLQTQITLRTFFTQPKAFELGSKTVK